MSLVEYSAFSLYHTTQSISWENWKNDEDHPFHHINSGCDYGNYNVEEMLELAPGDTSVTIDEMKTFPDNISRVVFAQSTNRDEDEWRIIGKCNRDIWFYFQAKSSWTGFDTGGEMKLCVSRDQRIFDEQCLDDITRYIVSRSNLPMPPLHGYRNQTDGKQSSGVIDLIGTSSIERKMFGIE
jgi:hypothetical protein